MLSNKCNMYCVNKIIYLNTLSSWFNNEEKEEKCTDFLILLGINDLRTFPYKVKKSKESYQIFAICVVKLRYFF